MANDLRNWAKKQTVGDRNAKGILLELADIANADGVLWYAIPTIAATLEMSTKTVERGLAALVEKKIIVREDREQTKGKFTSKLTRLVIPENDWTEILIDRARRELEKQTQKPTVKLSDGDDFPTDNLTVGDEKPTDNLSETPENQQTNCPEPTDKLSTGQNDGQYIRDKELISETFNLKHQEEEKRECITLSNVRGNSRNPRKNSLSEISESKKLIVFAHPAVIGYAEIFPNEQIGLSTFEDLTVLLPEVEESVWLQTLREWRMNPKWKPDNIPDIVDRYRNNLKKYLKENKGNAGNGLQLSERERKKLDQFSREERIRNRVKQRDAERGIS